MAALTSFYDFDGHQIRVGDVLRNYLGELGMVFGDTKSGYHLSSNKHDRDIKLLDHWADVLDNEYITEYKLRIDHGRWILMQGINSRFYNTYEEAKLSDLFGESVIEYITEEGVRLIDEWRTN